MNKVFLQRLRSTLYICKVVGCAHFSLERNPSPLNNTLALIIPLPFYILGIYCIFMAFKDIDMLTDYSTASDIIDITDLLSFIGTVVSLFLRSVYYFCKRNHIRNIIFQVSNQQNKEN